MDQSIDHLLNHLLNRSESVPNADYDRGFKDGYREGYVKCFCDCTEQTADSAVDVNVLSITGIKYNAKQMRTIAFFSDGSMSYVTYNPDYGFPFDMEKAICFCILKRMMGNDYLKLLKDYVHYDVPVVKSKSGKEIGNMGGNDDLLDADLLDSLDNTAVDGVDGFNLESFVNQLEEEKLEETDYGVESLDNDLLPIDLYECAEKCFSETFDLKSDLDFAVDNDRELLDAADFYARDLSSEDGDDE